MPTQEGSLLGIDLSLVNVSDARTKIVISCAKCWFEKNAYHLYNMSDCNGFLKAVQVDLHLKPFRGDANSIYGEVVERADWEVLGSGVGAAGAAGLAANQGALTIGIWKNPAAGKHGHVAIICSYLSLLGVKQAHHLIGAWGQIGRVGQLLGQMSESFGKDKLPQILYAKCLTPIL